MLLGTHTSEEEQNHLLLAEVHLPTEDSELASAQYDEESAEIGGYGASPGEYLPTQECMPGQRLSCHSASMSYKYMHILDLLALAAIA